MDKLRFGDFTGDGITDVLAVVGGHWSISESARLPWRRLNEHIDTAMSGLYIANMDADDAVDDILRIETKVVDIPPTDLAKATLTWWRSRNGVEPWKKFKEYSFAYRKNEEFVAPHWGFAGRFGPSVGASTLVIDPSRNGQFFSPAQAMVGNAIEWTSFFSY